MPLTNYKKFFRVDYALLRLAGIWISDDSEIKPKWYSAYVYWVFFVLAFYIMGLTGNCIQCRSIKEAAIAGYAETVTMMNPVKIFILLTHKNDLASNIEIFDNKYFQAKDQEEQEIVNRKLFKYRITTIVYATLVCLWLLSVIIAPVFSETQDGLVLPAYYPFNVSSSPGYEIAYSNQVIGIILAGIITVYTDVYMAASCTFIGLQCSLLSTRLSKIGCNERDYKESFSECLQQYQGILRFYETASKVFGKVYFWQLFSTTTSLSMILFVMSLTPAGSFEWFTLLMGTFSICSILLVPCTFASAMTSKSETISTSAFHSKWADMNNNTFTKDVMFFISKTQKPLLFKATWVFEISKTTYVSVLRVAMSYYTVLSNLNSPQDD